MLTNDMKLLLDFLANGNLTQARNIALRICRSETAAKNQAFCESVIKKIEQSPKMLSLPSNVGEFLFTDDVGVQFDEELFYVSSREELLAQQMIAVQRSAEKLQGVGVSYRNAVLMYGPSGSGKTSFAKHLAHLMDREFFVVNLANIIDSHLGGTAKNMSKVFRAISERGPNCLLFLDELDAVTESRDDAENSTSREMNRVTMSLMQLMDMLPRDTVVVAATNHLERIDYALRRRFPIIHKFELFSMEERREMLLKYLNTIKRRAESAASFSLDWDENDLNRYVENSIHVSHAKVIDTVIQSLAEMLEENQTHLTFKALMDTSGQAIPTGVSMEPGI